MPPGILRKPAAKDAFLLQEHLVDPPETAESETADDDGDGVVGHEKGYCTKRQPGHQPYPPASPAPVVFHLYDKRMADSYAKEYRCTYDDSVIIHITQINRCKFRQIRRDFLG